MDKNRELMTCPKCGHLMNWHAEKLVEPRSLRDAEDADPALGGLIEEMHACPNCGNVESRRGR
jgi:predicted RNA-binding Zn-ribbon protein involved in translation (DUF1610 family)